MKKWFGHEPMWWANAFLRNLFDMTVFGILPWDLIIAFSCIAVAAFIVAIDHMPDPAHVIAVAFCWPHIAVVLVVHKLTGLDLMHWESVESASSKGNTSS